MKNPFSKKSKPKISEKTSKDIGYAIDRAKNASSENNLSKALKNVNPEDAVVIKPAPRKSFFRRAINYLIESPIAQIAAPLVLLSGMAAGGYALKNNLSNEMKDNRNEVIEYVDDVKLGLENKIIGTDNSHLKLRLDEYGTNLDSLKGAISDTNKAVFDNRTYIVDAFEGISRTIKSNHSAVEDKYSDLRESISNTNGALITLGEGVRDIAGKTDEIVGNVHNINNRVGNLEAKHAQPSGNNQEIEKIEPIPSIKKKITPTSITQLGLYGGNDYGRVNSLFRNKNDSELNFEYFDQKTNLDFGDEKESKRNLSWFNLEFSGAGEKGLNLWVNKAAKKEDSNGSLTDFASFSEGGVDFTQDTIESWSEESKSGINSFGASKKFGKVGVGFEHSSEVEKTKGTNSLGTLVDFQSNPELNSIYSLTKVNSETGVDKNTSFVNFSYNFDKFDAGLSFKSIKTDVEANANVNGVSAINYNEKFEVNSLGGSIATSNDNSYMSFTGINNSGKEVENKFDYSFNLISSKLNKSDKDSKFPLGIGFGAGEVDGRNFGIVACSIGGDSKERKSNLETILKTIERNKLDPERKLDEQRYFDNFYALNNGNSGTSIFLEKGEKKDWGAGIATDLLPVDFSAIYEQDSTSKKLYSEISIPLSKKVSLKPFYVREQEKFDRKKSREDTYGVGVRVRY